MKNNFSANKAAQIHGVPVTTLKDRVAGRIAVEIFQASEATVFNKYEEEKFCNILNRWPPWAMVYQGHRPSGGSGICRHTLYSGQYLKNGLSDLIQIWHVDITAPQGVLYSLVT